MINFASDNTAPAHDCVIDALKEINVNFAPSYDAKSNIEDLQQQITKLFNAPCTVFPVGTGTAANGIAIAAMMPRHGFVMCQEFSHVNADECGAPEMISGGGKLVPMAGEDGKINTASLQKIMDYRWRGDVHSLQPFGITIAQANEVGRSYTLNELQSISKFAKENKLFLHIDGARLANSMSYLNASAEAMQQSIQCDLMSFGVTKTGGMMAELLVVFNQDLVEPIRFLQKRTGNLFSKMRFLSAQISALLKDDQWLKCAKLANDMALKLGNVFSANSQTELIYPVESNIVFVNIDDNIASQLANQGIIFHSTPTLTKNARRFVTNWTTSQEDVDTLAQALTKITK